MLGGSETVNAGRSMPNPAMPFMRQLRRRDAGAGGRAVGPAGCQDGPLCFGKANGTPPGFGKAAD